MTAVTDPLDELEVWIAQIHDDQDVMVVDTPAEPIGFMTVYDDDGKPFHGKIFEQRESADNAMAIMSGMMKPLFRVNVFPPRTKLRQT
ncbi:hypothetical protein [Shinella zoogloeoides]|uniref:hypothetical protein n=1 Tax=Shinella zoogloeoides TaxID=352475 RepID=UPI0027401C91|nr:hypothetical protein [Shinella zoogloeoides]WLR90958.1 hypothetical protein Q9316_00850 [Shinella zoogloeoides]